MNGFGHGIARAIGEIIGGIITSAILIAFVNSGVLSPIHVFLFILLNIVGTIILILVMPCWGTTYLIGWIVGLFLMFQSGLIGLEFVIYFVVPLVILIIRWRST